MKRILSFVLIILLLIISGCVNKDTEEVKYSEIIPTQVITTPNKTMSLEETIESYFDAKYDMYINMEYMDLSYYLDYSFLNNSNYSRWLKNLFLRRLVIDENRYFYVEKEKKQYKINFDETPEDDRMGFYEEREILPEHDEIVHFTISADTDTGYPPFFAMNDQHTMALKKINNRWKVLFHYFPGSSRHRSRSPINIISKADMEEMVLSELARDEDSFSNTTEYSEGIVYDGLAASEYARKYISSPNSRFYTIDDWMGNCANFTSQSIWYGFSKNENANIRNFMTKDWYAGYGGGSPAWENVGYFWRSLIKDKIDQREGLYGNTVDDIESLEIGGIAQIKSKISEENADFSHNLILVDKDKMLFAQNSPDCLIYYSDLVNVDFRFFNPKRLIVK